MTAGGFLAGSDLSPNSLEQARLRLEGRYVDLTSSNPTQNGHLFPAGVLLSLIHISEPTRPY